MELSFNNIYKMDCIKGMNNLPEKSIDIIVTFPPYNIGVKYNKYKDSLEFGEYLKWMFDFAVACKRVLKDNGSFFFNIGNRSSDELKAFEVSKTINDNNFRLQNTIHWIKSISIPERELGIGHFKPVNSKEYLNNCHEYIFHFTKNLDVNLDKLAIDVPYGHKSNIDRWKSSGQDLRDRGNIWFIPYKTVLSKKEHPASFPEKLPEMCIKLHGYTQNTVVLDPFLGSGTTCFVAKKLGCKYVGFDISKEYVELARRKIEEDGKG